MTLVELVAGYRPMAEMSETVEEEANEGDAGSGDVDSVTSTSRPVADVVTRRGCRQA